MGHMRINFNENKIQYKYILALPLSSDPAPLHFTAIFEVFYYTPSLFENSIISLLKEKQPLEEVVKNIV